MKYITTDSLADLRLTLSWGKNDICHTETYFADEANFYRDFFPPAISDKLINTHQGDRMEWTFKPGELIGDYTQKNVHPVRLKNVDHGRIPAPADRLRKGRCYPKGILSGITGIFSENVTPFRVRDVDESWVYADFNHPLAGSDLSLSVDILEIKDKRRERGGMASDWLEAVTTGPGIQARLNGHANDFFSDQPFTRHDSRPDTEFYTRDRLVSHIDSLARENLASLYRRYLKKGDLVLDLMSSWQSHLPDNLELQGLYGLGMNKTELEQNPRLAQRHVHDLNIYPVTPFEDKTFDAVICSLSVEYLTRPFEVFRDMARVLKPGGQFIVTFSNRWFPTKAIQIWPGLHEFERLGLVTEYFLESGDFESIETESLRGFPRPYTDDYFPKFKQSDPIYMVRGLRH